MSRAQQESLVQRGTGQGNRRRGPSPAKRAAIIDAARRVFGRVGFSDATIEAIAVESGVSTRTIYKHFAGKDELFAATLEASATRVADRFEAEVEHHIGEEPDLETDLRALGLAIARQRDSEPEHWAMMRQINRETERFKPEVLAGWQKAGPNRVAAVVQRELMRLGDAGLLRITDPNRAGAHFTMLVVAERAVAPAVLGSKPMTEAEVQKMVHAGVDTFLHGYAR
jgi:AcrR family transcriptional regulator